MEPLGGYPHPTNPDMIWKLKKAIYGLKQSPRDWYDHLINWMLAPVNKEDESKGGAGCEPSPNDPCQFKFKRDGKIIWIALCVDDMLIVGDQELIDEFVKRIGNKFKIRDLGEPTHFLGLEIKRAANKKSVTISCQKYIENMAKRFGVTAKNNAKVPMKEKLTMEDDLSLIHISEPTRR